MLYQLNKVMRRKTVQRMAKSGRIYYYNPNKVANPLELTDKYYTEEEVVKVHRNDKTNPHYQNYVEKKIALKREYPRYKWIEREDWLEYYHRLLNLIYSPDGDFQKWREETKTLQEREDDLWWEEKKQKEQQYNGRNDEYEYFG
jgi:hypothetical protein